MKESSTETKTVLGLLLANHTELLARLDSMHARLDSMHADNNARFDSAQAEIKKMQTAIFTIDNVTKSINKKVDHLKTNISSDFDFVCAAWIQILVVKLLKIDVPASAFKFRQHFVDIEGIIDPSKKGRRVDLEIDIFCEEPVLLAAELTWKLATGPVHKSPDEALKKIDKFIKKLDFLQWKFGKRPVAFFVCSTDINKEVLPILKKYLDQHEIIFVNFDGERITIQ